VRLFGHMHTVRMVRTGIDLKSLTKHDTTTKYVEDVSYRVISRELLSSVY